jgi:hypothetical protein
VQISNAASTVDFHSILQMHTSNVIVKQISTAASTAGFHSILQMNTSNVILNCNSNA